LRPAHSTSAARATTLDVFAETSLLIALLPIWTRSVGSTSHRLWIPHTAAYASGAARLFAHTRPAIAALAIRTVVITHTATSHTAVHASSTSSFLAHARSPIAGLAIRTIVITHAASSHTAAHVSPCVTALTYARLFITHTIAGTHPGDSTIWPTILVWITGRPFGAHHPIGTGRKAADTGIRVTDPWLRTISCWRTTIGPTHITVLALDADLSVGTGPVFITAIAAHIAAAHIAAAAEAGPSIAWESIGTARSGLAAVGQAHLFMTNFARCTGTRRTTSFGHTTAGFTPRTSRATGARFATGTRFATGAPGTIHSASAAFATGPTASTADAHICLILRPG
jgi:hypothetical protein